MVSYKDLLKFIFRNEKDIRFTKNKCKGKVICLKCACHILRNILHILCPIHAVLIIQLNVLLSIKNDN